MILIGIRDNKVELTYKEDGPPITDIRRIEIEQTCGKVSLRLEFNASYNIEIIKRQLQDLNELCGETSCVVTAIGETASAVLDNCPASPTLSTQPHPLSEREQQRRSFAYGNTHLENERITPAVIDRAAAKLSQPYERAPDGHINNCALANGSAEKDCQICNGKCPDRDKFDKALIADAKREMLGYVASNLPLK